MHAIEDPKSEDFAQIHTTSTTVTVSKVLIINAMTIIHPKKKSLKIIEEKLEKYDEGSIVFDRYICHQRTRTDSEDLKR